MELQISDTNGLLNNRLTPAMEESKSMYLGDLWLDGKGFIGEIAIPKSDKFHNDQKAKIKEGFVSQNVVEETIDRRVDGVLGREPIWKLIPKTQKEATEAEQRLIDEMEAAIVEWWNEFQILGMLRNAVIDASCYQRSNIRPFVPRGFKDKTGNLQPQKTLSDALALLHFETVLPSTAGVFLEENTLQPYSIFKTERNGDTEIEFSFVDGDGITHFKTFKEVEFSRFAEDVLPTIASYIVKKTSNPQTGDTAINLDGKLFLFELDLRTAFTTDAIKQKQKELNLAYTMMGRNINLAGSRERYFFNTRSPKAKVKVTDANSPTGQREVSEDVPMYIGSGAANFLQGSYIHDENGSIKGVANPNVSITDPVSVESFKQTIAIAYAGILSECDQLHVLMNETATASGISRREARAEFEKSLKNIKAYVDALGRYIVEFAMAFAAVLTGREKEFSVFRCDFNCIVDAGMPTPEERAANIADYTAGVISLETLMSRNGVEDTDAELARIKGETGYEINLLAKVLEVLNLATGKLPLQMQAEILVSTLGWEETKINELMTGLATENEPLTDEEIGQGATA